MDLKEYNVDTSNEYKPQEDYYYDTEDRYLFEENKTLRFRKSDNKYQLTIKTPTKGTNNAQTNNAQNERFEYEVSVDSRDINENKEYIIKYLPELEIENRLKSLKKTMTITNCRKKTNLQNNDVKFEIVFDKIKYINESTGKQESDYQIEIELKSDYLHRINLKILSDYLEKKVPELKPMNESKYKRGLKLTE